MSLAKRLRRSELSTPGSDMHMIDKAIRSHADLVFLDLEDAVAPAEKASARRNVIAGLACPEWIPQTRAVRINGVRTEWCHDDLIEVVSGAKGMVDVVIIPKVTSPHDVLFVDALLTQLELKLNLPLGAIGLEVLIEEVEALASVDEIARSSPRLEALILGVGDLSASQGMRATHLGVADDSDGSSGYPGDIWHYARSRLIVAARVNGLDAVDGPFADFRNGDGYRRSAGWASSLGAVGKWCIHPGQIEIANEVFAPTSDEISRAEAVVRAMREAEANGFGAASLDGVLIDAASARVFEAVLERARSCGL